MLDGNTAALNRYLDEQDQAPELDLEAQQEALREARKSLIQGTGLHELLADLPDNMAHPTYLNLQDLLLNGDEEEFKEQLFRLFKLEWDAQAREAAGL